MLGLAGSRHFLVLGLPLMRALGPQQLAAVIAHEFGHFNAGHGRYAGWIYRVRESWYRLLDAMHRQGSAIGGVFTRFFSWYAPYFNAYSFVLARDNEYEADAVSARLVGADSMAQALVRTELASRRLATRFWPDLERLNLVQAEPPPSLFEPMVAVLRSNDSSDVDSLDQALRRDSGLDDTHPTLSQRLRALGVDATLPDAPEQSAAKQYLGALADALQAQFDSDWREAATPQWEARYRAHAEGREQLRHLRMQRAQRELDANELAQYAVLVDDLGPADTGPAESATELFQEVLRRDPMHALAHFRLGIARLQEDGDTAIVHLEAAMRSDPDATGHALHLLAGLYEQREDDAALDAIRARQNAWFKQQEDAAAARQNLNAGDIFEAHALDEPSLDAVRQPIAAHGKIGKAWLVRKRVPGAERLPHFVLLVQWRGMVLREQAQLQRLLDTIEVPGTLFAVTTGVSAGLAKRIKRVAGGPLYRKGWFG
jgi:hypothetical protein